MRSSDISELYDYIQERRNCYFVGVDIMSLVPINQISREAGDIAILISIPQALVALTNSEDKEYTDKIEEETIKYSELFQQCSGNWTA